MRVLAFVSSGILGQYDPFSDGGSLLLVYPNVIAVERQLRLEPSDFRLWVCLHEVTHRVQFTANPWLSGYMSQALGVLTQEGSDDVAQVVSRLADFARGRGDSVARRPELDRASSGCCAPCSPTRNAKRWISCWCSARCWRAMPTM